MTILDDGDAGTIQLSQIIFTPSEGDGVVQFPVSRLSTNGSSHPSLCCSGVVQVNYRTMDGTALLSGSDYSVSQGTLLFNDREVAKDISVEIRNDLKIEIPDEYFWIEITSVDLGGIPGTPLTSRVVLIDDGDASTVQFLHSKKTVVEGNLLMTITIARTGNMEKLLNFTWRTGMLYSDLINVLFVFGIPLILSILPMLCVLLFHGLFFIFLFFSFFFFFFLFLVSCSRSRSFFFLQNTDNGTASTHDDFGEITKGYAWTGPNVNETFIEVSIIQDDLYEGAYENFSVVLEGFTEARSATEAVIGIRNRLVVEILDDEDVSIEFANTTISVVECGCNVLVTVTRLCESNNNRASMFDISFNEALGTAKYTGGIPDFSLPISQFEMTTNRVLTFNLTFIQNIVFDNPSKFMVGQISPTYPNITATRLSTTDRRYAYVLFCVVLCCFVLFCVFVCF